MASYVPEAGDLVWLTFDPQAGHEQAGRRPALILSPRAYNQASSLALACPVTSQVKGYPFEVAIAHGRQFAGVILADHVRSVDWKARRASRIAQAGEDVLDEVLAKLTPLLGF
jgi:mRNA interferase MazF